MSRGFDVVADAVERLLDLPPGFDYSLARAGDRLRLQIVALHPHTDWTAEAEWPACDRRMMVERILRAIAAEDPSILPPDEACYSRVTVLLPEIESHAVQVAAVEWREPEQWDEWD